MHCLGIVSRHICKGIWFSSGLRRVAIVIVSLALLPGSLSTFVTLCNFLSTWKVAAIPQVVLFWRNTFGAHSSNAIRNSVTALSGAAATRTEINAHIAAKTVLFGM